MSRWDDVRCCAGRERYSIHAEILPLVCFLCRRGRWSVGTFFFLDTNTERVNSFSWMNSTGRIFMPLTDWPALCEAGCVVHFAFFLQTMLVFEPCKSRSSETSCRPKTNMWGAHGVPESRGTEALPFAYFERLPAVYLWISCVSVQSSCRMRSQRLEGHCKNIKILLLNSKGNPERHWKSTVT